ncbi:MAG: hypothetical protein ACLGIN_13280 [Candidatus Sericytochromatia bacterium]
MAIYPASAAILVPALVLNAAVVGSAIWLRRPATPRGALLPAAAAAALVLLGAGLLALFGEWDRQWPVIMGLALGLANGLIWHWAFPSGDRDAGQTGPIAAGGVIVAVIALMLPDPTVMANALLGALLGWGAIGVLTALKDPIGEDGASLGLVTTAVVAAGAAWGEKLQPGVQLGAPLAVALVTALAVGLAIGQRAANGRALSGVIAAAVFLLAALGLLSGLYAQPVGLVVAVAAGAVIGAVAPAFVRAGPAGALGAVAVLVLGGVLLVVDNRLMGVLAIALGGIGLAAGATSGARGVLTLLVAIFAARAWLQLFLDRTLLTAYGVDLTHPYAFAALVTGGLLPVVAALAGRVVRPEGPLLAAWAIALAAVPAWVGYFIHVEALGSLLAGLMAAAFVLGAAQGEETMAEARHLAPSLLTVSIASTLLAAPWLVTVMNATRSERLVVLLVGLAILAVALIYGWVRLGRRPLPQA